MLRVYSDFSGKEDQIIPKGITTSQTPKAKAVKDGFSPE